LTEYSVPVVERAQLSLWHEYWDGQEPSARAKTANANGSLEKTIIVTARNPSEAAMIAEKKRPGHTAIRSSIKSLGRSA
jgi:hypothetical protein